MSAPDRIRAPYGFVPLSREVFLPEWGDAASRDLPFADGVRGSVRVEVTAKSPIFVRGTASKELPFQLPNGTYALPGSALRGMLRNTVEIATFGKLGRINDHRYALRDLYNHRSYVSHMAKILDRQPVPLVNAGWLVPTGDASAPALIHPCHFAKLEYADLQAVAAQAWKVEGFDPGRKQSAVDKYLKVLGWSPRTEERPEGWQDKRPARVRLAIERIERPVPGLRSEYGKVRGPGQALCSVVMTGQPAPYVPDRPKGKGSGNPKHHDFVFHGSAGAPIPVSADALRDFEFGHSASGQQHSLEKSVAPNTEWGFWKELVWNRDPAWFEGKPERGVPVFFLLEEGARALRAMGLAMMFRLAGRTSVGESVRRAQPKVDDPRPDFAETLFGRVPDHRRGADKVAFALAGRVSVGVGRAEGKVEPGKPVGPLVLGTPKASYYPSYVEQRAGRPGQPPERDEETKRVWKTWMDSDAVPRGWKRYRPIEGHATVTPPAPKDGKGQPLNLDKVGTMFRPLPAGTRFTTELRLHNVREVELGALLWALDFGGAKEACHKLGLARPLGYGTVALRVDGHDLVRNDGRTVDLAAAVAAFRGEMDEAWRRMGGRGGWADSAPIRELVALAGQQPLEDARHMQIDHPRFGNEFQQAKLAGLVLEPVAKGGEGTGPEPAGLPPASGPRVTAAVAKSGPPGLPSAGQRVRIRLTGQNKKGRWQAELVSGAGSGTLVKGTPPVGAAAGLEVDAEVLRAAGRFSIELGWTGRDDQ